MKKKKTVYALFQEDISSPLTKQGLEYPYRLSNNKHAIKFIFYTETWKLNMFLCSQSKKQWWYG